MKSPEAELRSGCLKPGAALEARSHLARHTAPAAIAARRCLVAEHPGGGAMVTALPLVHARLFFSRPWGLVEGGPSGCALTRTSSGSGCLRGPLFSFVSARSFPPPLRIAGGRPPPPPGQQGRAGRESRTRRWSRHKELHKHQVWTQFFQTDPKMTLILPNARHKMNMPSNLRVWYD